MILPRRFLRACHRSMFRLKVADSSGAELSGARLLTGALLFRRLFRREVLAADERNVGLLLPPSAAAVVANAALAIDGRVGVNLNYTLNSDVLQECVRQAGIRHVITSRRVLERLPDLKFEAELVVLEDFRSRISKSDKLWAALTAWTVPPFVLERWLGLHRLRPDDLQTIIFTSGSTGRPKGVMLSHENIGSNLTSFRAVLDLRRGDVMLGVLPLFHSFGYTTTLWTALSLDVQLVFHYTPLEPRPIGQLCRKYRVNAMVAAPTFLHNYVRRCEADDFAHLQFVITGSEKLPVSLADQFQRKFRVRPVEGYGTTEVSPVVSTNIPPGRQSVDGRTDCREGSVGLPIPGVEVKVVDPDTGEDLGADRSGMLLVRGPNVMLGYLNEPEQTARVIRDGWYVTGDIAMVDAEGFIHITGRQSRFSKIGGEMVPHVRVEEVLLEVLNIEHDELPRLAVAGVPDPRKGERLVVLHTGLDIATEQICRRLHEAGLPPLWLPSADSFYHVAAIPRLGTGKLDLGALRTLALETALGQRHST